MMKFFAPDSLDPDTRYSMAETAEAALDVGVEGLWAYEGVVLPGGNLIVGRWWSPGTGDGLGLEAPGNHAQGDDDNGGVYGGPFLWWCID